MRGRFAWAYCIIFGYVIVYLSYILLQGENVYMAIHDNLDSNVVWYRMLASNDLFWKWDASVPFLSGLDRNYLASEWKVYSWFHMLLPTFYAIIAADIARTLLSVYGFVKLGRLAFADSWPSCCNIVVLCGFAYGILPVFPSCGIDFAALPLILFFIVQFYRTNQLRYLILTSLAGFFCTFIAFGLFMCGFLLLAFCIDSIVHHRITWSLLAATVVTALSFVFTEARLFYTMLFSDMETIRSTMDFATLPAAECIKQMIQSMINGHYHSEALQKYVVLPVCGIYFLVATIQRIQRRKLVDLLKDPFNWCMVWAGFNAVVYGLDSWLPFRTLVAVLIPPLNGFSFARTLWFSPFALYLAFCIALCRMYLCWKKSHWAKYLPYVLAGLSIMVVCGISATYGHIPMNLRNIVRQTIRHKAPVGLTYAEFYSEELFSEIKREIGYEGEYSIAFGMHPAVLEYNGISTLDGYISCYPQAYKEQFRRLIVPELNEDEANRRYFDDWGGRAYIFSPELLYEPTREPNVTQAELKIDPTVFAEMSGKYVFSRVEITNDTELGLSLQGVFTQETSPYEIYVYASNQQ